VDNFNYQYYRCKRQIPNKINLTSVYSDLYREEKCQLSKNTLQQERKKTLLNFCYK